MAAEEFTYLVSTKTTRLETVDELPLECLAVSPQCGFASTAEGNRLSPDDQRRKLGVVAETARAVWPRA
jgi:5-methyltetrahydropteroyltriglutamate--homocysteine methyltransferase